MIPADPTLSVAERVDAACDRFESGWKAGRKPRIDEFVAAAPESDREELRQALLALEIELQGRSEADTSVSRSSVRSDGKPTPEMTLDQIQTDESSKSTIGRFEIRGVLGSGAFGKVYRAFDPQLGREVAVKVPLATAVKTEKERAQFLKEARSAANINHPNVCQVHEVGEANGRPYIVMALVRGQSLADTLKARKEPLPEKQSALIVRKIALALAAAHDSGIVHRDLKPANVMFDRERNDIIVMDFGLARGPRLADARGTQSGVIMGTPAYMSPEQARGDSKGVGPAGDIFSLGVILYELLAGARPFTGTATEVIGKILHVEPEKPSAVRPGVDPRLEAICLKAMSKDTSARFATMKEFAAAVDAVLRAPAPVGPAAETARAEKTRRDGEDVTSSENMANLFAVMSVERKATRAETAAAVDAAIKKHRTPPWVFVAVGLAMVFGFLVLGGIVFFTRSDKVKVDLTVVLKDVDLADKSLSFFLDEEPITVEVLAKPVELKPGVHIFTVKRGKEIVKRVEIRVEGGRNPGIKVEDITPKEPPPVKPLTPEEEDRAFAEWLFSVGTTSVTVSVGSNQLKVIAKAAELPAGSFRVMSFDTWGNQKVTDENSDRIVRWLIRSDADSINFHGTQIGDATMAKLVEIKKLKKVWLGGTKITNRSLELLAKRPELNLAGFDGTAVTDAGLVHLRGLTDLDSLAFFNTRVTDEGMKNFAGLQKLRSLNLGASDVSAEGLRQLKGLPIQELNITQTRVAPADLGVLKGFPALSLLIVANLSIRDESLAPLTELKGLETLHIGHNRITDSGLRTLAACKGLKELDVRNNPVSEAELEKLRKALPDCRVLPERADPKDGARTAAGWVLSAGGSVRVNDRTADIKAAKDLPKEPFRLTGVNLYGNQRVTDDDLSAFKGCKDVTSLTLSSPKVTDAGLAHFKDRKGMKDLFLWGVPVTDTGLAHFKDCKGLKQLVLWNVPVTDAGLAHFEGCKGLGHLVLAGSKVTDAGMAYFKDCKALQTIDLSNTRVGDTGLAHFKGCKDLCDAFLSGTRVSDAGLVVLKSSKVLRTVGLEGTRVSDAGLAHLKDCAAFTTLNVKNTQVTATGIGELQKVLPGCQVIWDGGTIEPKQ